MSNEFVTVKREVLELVIEKAEAITKHFNIERIGESTYKDTNTRCELHEAVNKLRAALEQPGVEPVAWVWNPAKESWEKLHVFGHWQQGAIYAFGPEAPQPVQQAVESVRGWKLVPVEPTPEMLQAGRETPCSASEEDCAEDYRAVYKAMLEAAPQPVQQPPRVGTGKTAEQAIAQWEHDLENPLTPEQGEDFARRERAFAAQQPAQQAVTMFSVEELNWLRQWFDSMEDTNGCYIIDEDRVLYQKILAAISAAPNPVQPEVDWTQVGKLIEVVGDQRVRQHITGTSNWAAAVCMLMAEATWSVKKEERP